ncbi:unnamed protein product [Closterium sp. NIES-64]|nr:unnamed protein product [Closterium sp. NIES-64]
MGVGGAQVRVGEAGAKTSLTPASPIPTSGPHFLPPTVRPPPHCSQKRYLVPSPYPPFPPLPHPPLPHSPFPPLPHPPFPTLLSPPFPAPHLLLPRQRLAHEFLPMQSVAPAVRSERWGGEGEVKGDEGVGRRRGEKREGCFWGWRRPLRTPRWCRGWGVARGWGAAAVLWVEGAGLDIAKLRTCFSYSQIHPFSCRTFSYSDFTPSHPHINLINHLCPPASPTPTSSPLTAPTPMLWARSSPPQQAELGGTDGCPVGPWQFLRMEEQRETGRAVFVLVIR